MRDAYFCGLSRLFLEQAIEVATGEQHLRHDLEARLNENV